MTGEAVALSEVSEVSEEVAPEVQALALLEAEPEGEVEEEGEQEAEPEPEPEKVEPELDKAERRKSRIIAELARKEVQILEAQQSLEAQQQRLQAKAQEIQKWEQTVALAKTDPLQFLEASGIDINTLTRQILNQEDQPKPSPEVDALRAELESFKATQQEQQNQYQQRQLNQAISEEKQRLAGFVASHGDDFPMLADLDSEEIQEGMFDVMRSHWQKTGTQLDPSMAARIIEEKLSAYYQRLANAASKRKGASQSETAATAPSSDTGSRTLTKAHGSRTAQDPNTLSEQQRQELALELLGSIPDD